MGAFGSKRPRRSRYEYGYVGGTFANTTPLPEQAHNPKYDGMSIDDILNMSKPIVDLSRTNYPAEFPPPPVQQVGTKSNYDEDSYKTMMREKMAYQKWESYLHLYYNKFQETFRIYVSCLKLDERNEIVPHPDLRKYVIRFLVEAEKHDFLVTKMREKGWYSLQ